LVLSYRHFGMSAECLGSPEVPLLLVVGLVHFPPLQFVRLKLWLHPVDIAEPLLVHGVRARVAQGIAMLMLPGTSPCSSCTCSFDHRIGVVSVWPRRSRPKHPITNVAMLQCWFPLLCPNSPINFTPTISALIVSEPELSAHLAQRFRPPVSEQGIVVVLHHFGRALVSGYETMFLHIYTYSSPCSNHLPFPCSDHRTKADKHTFFLPF